MGQAHLVAASEDQPRLAGEGNPEVRRRAEEDLERRDLAVAVAIRTLRAEPLRAAARAVLLRPQAEAGFGRLLSLKFQIVLSTSPALREAGRKLQDPLRGQLRLGPARKAAKPTHRAAEVSQAMAAASIPATATIRTSHMEAEV